MSNSLFRALPLLLLTGGALVGLSACSDDETAVENPVLGCDLPSHHSCVDYGTAFSQEDAAANCSGDVLQGPCPTSNSVGTCVVQVASFTLNEYYYSSSWSAADAEMDCTTAGGTWSG